MAAAPSWHIHAKDVVPPAAVMLVHVNLTGVHNSWDPTAAHRVHYVVIVMPLQLQALACEALLHIVDGGQCCSSQTVKWCTSRLAQEYLTLTALAMLQCHTHITPAVDLVMHICCTAVARFLWCCGRWRSFLSDSLVFNLFQCPRASHLLNCHLPTNGPSYGRQFIHRVTDPGKAMGASMSLHIDVAATALRATASGSIARGSMELRAVAAVQQAARENGSGTSVCQGGMLASIGHLPICDKCAG
jgi:hypothetical protein